MLGRAAPGRGLRLAGALGLVAVVSACLLLAAAAASHPTVYVPATRFGGFPAWLSGPLHGLRLGFSPAGFQALVVLMALGYTLTLLGAGRLSLRAVLGAALIAHLAMLMAPVLLSQDVFGYEDFARLGALHGLDPYSHASTALPSDPAYRFVGWHTVHSPYGPLFTLASYAVAPLGVAGGLWALKVTAVVASLATVAVVAHTAERLGQSPAFAAAFVGLNPVLLVNAVGGAHNDTLTMLAMAVTLSLAAGARWGPAALTTVAAVAIKLSAGLLLPLIVLAPREWPVRLRVAAQALAGLAAVAGLAVLGFDGHAFGFLSALNDQQQMVATHSVPNETARLLGLHGLPRWWRDAWVGAFVVALALALWSTARGADWRRAAGWATLALLLSTAWLLPWYAIWLLPLAALAPDRRLRAATLTFCLYCLLIRLPAFEALLGGRRS